MGEWLESLTDNPVIDLAAQAVRRPRPASDGGCLWAAEHGAVTFPLTEGTRVSVLLGEQVARQP
jgi:hypothetical protein